MLGVVALIPCSSAAAGTHTGGALTINDSATPPTAAAPYPSTITVSGEKPIVTAVSVRVRSFTHALPEEVDLLLVGPSGQSVLLMSDLGDGAEVNENFTVSDGALGPGTGVGGSFRPTDLDDDVGDLDDFPPPAPSGPYGSSLSALGQSTANGTWRLYAVDDTEDDSGSIGAWELRITSRDPWTVGILTPLSPPFGFPETSGTVNVVVDRGIGPALRAASLSYATFPASREPTPGVDYVPQSGRFEWGAGESGRRVVPIRILDDKVSERQECVGVAFLDPAGDLSLSPGSAQFVCIADDEPLILPAPVPGLTGRKVQRPLRQGGVVVTVRPNHAVDVTATGRIVIPGGASAVVRLKRVVRRVAGGRATALKLRLSKRGRRAVGRAFESRKQLRATVSVRIVDDLDRVATARRKLTLKR
jgi:subtilisin-like proprotein convertase family protein